WVQILSNTLSQFIDFRHICNLLFYTFYFYSTYNNGCSNLIFCRTLVLVPFQPNFLPTPLFGS
ncbi:MAG: hypothetical protein ACK4UP_10260, partial [Spirosomataceae bacterium]